MKWKRINIKGKDTNYKVSNTGAVKNTKTGKFLVPTLVNGYPTYGIYLNVYRYTVAAHILVGKYFVDGWFEGAVINHIDEDRINPHHTNLEYTTQEYNVNYSIERRKQGIPQPKIWTGKEYKESLKYHDLRIDK